jgi:inorganic pyrophosphatase
MESVEIIIETPKGSNLKYTYDPAGFFKAKKALPLGMIFPYDFGFIPGTKGEDGDPLDAMLISEFHLETGCHIDCRLIGALLAEQSDEGKKIRNDRYFFIPEESVVFSQVRSIRKLGHKHNSQLLEFFINYNKAEGKTFRPLRMVRAPKAAEMIKKNKA